MGCRWYGNFVSGHFIAGHIVPMGPNLVHTQESKIVLDIVSV